MTSQSTFCLLLTGTIAPRNVPNLKRYAIQDRENDYVQAIEKWLSTGYPVVFCENSNYHSILIKTLFEKYPNAEFLQFETQHSHLGKGHGETEILMFAFKHSRLLNQTNHWVVKVTARYFVKNYSVLLKNVLYFENAQVIANLDDYLRYADTRFFIFSQSFFEQYLSKQLPFINEKSFVFFEHLLARAIHAALADGGNWYPLPDSPIFVGYYATENVRYQNSYLRLLKRAFFQRIRNWAIRYKSW